jgi:hypothetical protein
MISLQTQEEKNESGKETKPSKYNSKQVAVVDHRCRQVL